MFLVMGTVLYFAFGMRIMLLTHDVLGMAEQFLGSVKDFSAPHPPQQHGVWGYTSSWEGTELTPSDPGDVPWHTVPAEQ